MTPTKKERGLMNTAAYEKIKRLGLLDRNKVDNGLILKLDGTLHVGPMDFRGTHVAVAEINRAAKTVNVADNPAINLALFKL